MSIPELVQLGVQSQEQKIAHDFSRDVVALLGMPLDCISLSACVNRIIEDSQKPIRCFLTTPNLNFLILSRNDRGFLQSIINSDLIPVDGFSIIFLARLLGISGLKKAPGSTVFEQITLQKKIAPLSVFFLGGDDDTSYLAMQKVNSEITGIRCVGAINPGTGSPEKLTSTDLQNKINEANPDFLVVALGAKKGQQWIELNRPHLKAPIISHLGAVLNFTAGKIVRAPKYVQRLNLEWLWRIKEQPPLFKRYLFDGLHYISLAIRVALPYSILKKRFSPAEPHKLVITERVMGESIELIALGVISKDTIELLKPFLIRCCSFKQVNLNFKGASYIDAHGIGQILLLYKYVGENLSVVDASNYVKKAFGYEGLSWLITVHSTERA